MGADIHCYVEYTEKAGSVPLDDWQCFGGRINPGRNYYLFGLLAGVRGGPPIFEPRGMPQSYSYEVRGDHLIYVSDGGGENTVTPERAEQLVNSCCAQYVKSVNGAEKAFITHPDYHSHSFLSLDEYACVLKECEKAIDYKYSISPEYYAVKAAMMELEKLGYVSRLVFWFDS